MSRPGQAAHQHAGEVAAAEGARADKKATAAGEVVGSAAAQVYHRPAPHIGRVCHARAACTQQTAWPRYLLIKWPRRLRGQNTSASTTAANGRAATLVVQMCLQHSCVHTISRFHGYTTPSQAAYTAD